MTNGQWLVVVALAFVWGWLTADWRRDSLELAINSAAQVAGEKSRVAMQGIASDSARELEEKLEALESGRPKEIRTEIVKPVFTNVCVSADFIRMFNATVENTEHTLSGKPEAKMPNGKSSAY
ncbi:hypothetical protein DAI21_10265 [Lelliottia sp. WB101]|uniref:hypothetical protein n=1 Tax=Lelliottia sp. WB101 TaxID=2153385 RepID=UPI000D20F5B2|nr:hypothetical protein [Lelliottia sp. WB101]AVY98017.1 hypothetical protein DAI21_10265 [Lelliottia sp. WB101]